jgi:hypothetical protein
MTRPLDSLYWIDVHYNMAHGYFVLHAVCSACRFGVNGNFNLFFWVNGNFILFFLGEREFWKKINSMWFLSLQK